MKRKIFLLFILFLITVWSSERLIWNSNSLTCQFKNCLYMFVFFFNSLLRNEKFQKHLVILKVNQLNYTQKYYHSINISKFLLYYYFLKLFLFKKNFLFEILIVAHLGCPRRYS